MKLIKLIILSIIQGICEVLPISSSGHLILFKHLLNVNSYGLTLEIILHLGSLFAVIYYYRNELFKLIKNSINYLKGNKNNKKYFELLLNLFISTFITSIIALLFNSFIENTLSNILFLPIFFLITSILISFSNNKNKIKSIYEISIIDAIIIGLFQGIGIIPGISRSGITYFSLSLRKVNSNDSFKYSFLLFIPITFASFLNKLLSFSSNEVLTYPIYYYIISILISGFTTYFALKLFSKLLSKNKYYYFSIYLIILSSLILFFL